MFDKTSAISPLLSSNNQKSSILISTNQNSPSLMSTHQKSPMLTSTNQKSPMLSGSVTPAKLFTRYSAPIKSPILTSSLLSSSLLTSPSNHRYAAARQHSYKQTQQSPTNNKIELKSIKICKSSFVFNRVVERTRIFDVE